MPKLPISKVGQMSKQIPLRNSSLTVLVDDEDYDWLAQFSWYPHRRCVRSRFGRNEFYAARSSAKGVVLMHREIMQTPTGMKTDHRNNNGLDNQRHNLRIANSSQNGTNTRPRVNATGYRGVYNTPKAHKPFIAQIMFNRKQVYLGHHETALAGALAYDEAAKQYHGEFATLNFPEERSHD